MPARQNSHCVAPALDVEPAAQTVQLDAPGSAENVPAAHSSMTLVPLHAEPAGPTLQAVRVVSSPPVVNEPSGHIEHAAASFELKEWSDPHSVQFAAAGPDAVPARHGEHDDALPAAYVPATHTVLMLVPSHA